MLMPVRLHNFEPAPSGVSCRAEFAPDPIADRMMHSYQNISTSIAAQLKVRGIIGRGMGTLHTRFHSPADYSNA
jgi:hypothetical protein